MIKEDLYGKFPHLYPKIFVSILMPVAIEQLFAAFFHSNRGNILSGFFMIWSALIWFVISGIFIAAYPPLSTGMTIYPLIAIICALTGGFLGSIVVSDYKRYEQYLRSSLLLSVCFLQ